MSGKLGTKTEQFLEQKLQRLYASSVDRKSSVFKMMENSYKLRLEWERMVLL